jgi:hypothetical protein
MIGPKGTLAQASPRLVALAAWYYGLVSRTQYVGFKNGWYHPNKRMQAK